MTKEELDKLPFLWVSHLNMTDGYVSIYKNYANGIEMHKVTKRKNEFETGKTKQIYFYQGREYKSVDKLLEAINKEEEQ